MPLKITPGDLPKDGEGLGPNPGTVLEAFVENTVIENIDAENFVERAGSFYVSGTDPPGTRAPGMLWFARGDGRLYMWHTQMPSAASTATVNLVGGSPASLSWARNNLEAGHWMPLSDRKMLAAEAYDESLNAYNLPYSTLRLGAGRVSSSATAQGDDTVRTPIAGAYQLPYSGSTSAWGGSVDASYMPRLESWGSNVLGSKLAMRTTGTTLAGVTLETGVYLDLGYYRLGVHPSMGAGPAGVGVDKRDTLASISPDDDKKTLLHQPDANNPYTWAKDKAFTALITESGPGSTTSENVARRLGFFFHSTPNAGWNP